MTKRQEQAWRLYRIYEDVDIVARRMGINRGTAQTYITEQRRKHMTVEERRLLAAKKAKKARPKRRSEWSLEEINTEFVRTLEAEASRTKITKKKKKTASGLLTRGYAYSSVARTIGCSDEVLFFYLPEIKMMEADHAA